jgi:HK97 family phage portal protein
MSFKSRFKSFLGLETKSGVSNPDPWLFEQFCGGTSAAGIAVTPRTAMECAPVRCGVQAIAETIGQLPLKVFQRGVDNSKAAAPDHPAYKLLHDAADPSTPAALFREWITRDALLRPYGGFAFINRGADGKPLELNYLDPDVSPVTVDRSTGEPLYTIQEGSDKREIARENILHIPSPSMSGRGLAYDARNAIGLALVLERYANRLFANGVRPGSLLLAKDAKTPDAVKNIKALFNAQFSGDGTGSNAVLPGDLSYQQLTLSSVDAQFLEMRKFAIEEIARHLRVPPHILYELGRATWGNSEEMSQHFLDFTMMRWITAWEGELRLKLFANDTHFAEFQTDNFVRANYAARMEGLSKAIAARVINPNEARAILNLAPYTGGDEFMNPNVQTANLT